MRVPIREFKSHISQYLRSVVAGEPVIITVHNKPVARVEALPAEGGDSLATIRGVVWSGGKPTGCSIRLLGPGKTAADTVIEDRR